MNRRGVATMGLLSFLSGFWRRADAAQPELLALQSDTLNELASAAHQGAQWLTGLVPSATEMGPAQIDQAIEMWRASQSPKKESRDQVVEWTGALFGQHLIKRLGLEWRAYRDQRGTDLCVVHPKVWVYSFPHSSTYKAVVQGRKGALQEVELALGKQIQEALIDPRIKDR